jgi:hypothetical protein
MSGSIATTVSGTPYRQAGERSFEPNKPQFGLIKFRNQQHTCRLPGFWYSLFCIPRDSVWRCSSCGQVYAYRAASATLKFAVLDRFFSAWLTTTDAVWEANGGTLETEENQ